MDTQGLLRKAQEVILAVGSTKEQIDEAVAAVEATKDRHAIMVLRHTLQWLAPENHPGVEPPAA
jgi:hypothetical protein